LLHFGYKSTTKIAHTQENKDFFCVFQKLLLPLHAESTNNLYIQLVYGRFEYNIIKPEKCFYTSMAGNGL